MTAVELIVKTCTKCGEEKPATGFSPDKRTPSGLRSWCKACNNEAVKRRQAKRRAAMGEEAWRAHVAETTRRSRQNPEVRARGHASNAAYFAALMKLREAHPQEFEGLLTVERYERGLA